MSVSRARGRSCPAPSTALSRVRNDVVPTASSRPLNDRDRWLCSIIGPKLKAAGMVFVGLDVIGDFVTEINVTSPTGIRELNKKHGVDIGALLVKAIAGILDAR